MLVNHNRGDVLPLRVHNVTVLTLGYGVMNSSSLVLFLCVSGCPERSSLFPHGHVSKVGCSVADTSGDLRSCVR